MSVVEKIAEGASRLTPEQQERVLKLIEALQRHAGDDDRKWGEVGRRLLADSLDPDEDWSWLGNGDRG